MARWLQMACPFAVANHLSAMRLTLESCVNEAVLQPPGKGTDMLPEIWKADSKEGGLGKMAQRVF